MRFRVLLRRLQALEPRELLALVPATIQVIVARAALRALPLRKVLERVDHPLQDVNTALQLDDRTRRHIRAIERVGHGLFPKSPCLTQAIVVQRLLRKKGHASDLRIGVRKGTGQPLEAHAWVEYRGAVVIGARGLSEEHTRLPSLAPAKPPKAKAAPEHSP